MSVELNNFTESIIIDKFNDNIFVSYLHVFYKIEKLILREIFIAANSYDDFKDRIRKMNVELYEEIEANTEFSHPPAGTLEDINEIRHILQLEALK